VQTTGEGPACEDSAFVWDQDSRRIIAFGGRIMGDYSEASGWEESMLSDTWAYDPATSTWTNLEPAGPVPPARWGAGIGYDPISRRVVLCGGEGTGSDLVLMSDDSVLQGTWAYDPAANAWSEVLGAIGTPYGYTGYTSIPLFFDPALRLMISVTDYEIYTYDLVNSWSSIPYARAVTPERGGQAFAYDPDEHQLILFGGTNSSGDLNDIWTCKLVP
jgi:hypothetical protein